jgi:hypothetical protein
VAQGQHGGQAARAITLRDANAFVAAHHRHHKPARGCKFVVAAVDVSRRAVCGVAVVGRPVSREIQAREPLTCEVVRVATDGTRNACSFLLARCREAAFAIGYRRVITYTLPEEGGASLKAAGYRRLEDADGSPLLFGGGSWDAPSRRRNDHAPTCPKWLWEARR